MIALAGGACLPPAALRAQGAGGPAAPPAPAPASAPTPAQVEGGRLFDDAVRWVARGRAPAPAVRDLMLSLDAKLDYEGTRHEGPLRWWLELPERYRQELTLFNTTTTRILRGDDLYVRTGQGAFTHANRTPDGPAAVEQARKDRQRLVEISRLLTLEGLRVPGAVFELAGEVTSPGRDVPYAKVVRKVQGQPDVTLWLVRERDAQGTLRATSPEIVRIAADPTTGSAMEDVHLKDWREPPASRPDAPRFPRKILAFQIRPEQPPVNLLTAIVLDVRINAGIDPALFEAR